jgi:hypothetical protein
VSAGHGLVVMGGFGSDSAPEASIAASYGVSYVPGTIESAAPGTYVSDLAVPELTQGVSSLLVYGGFRLTSTDPNAVAFATLGQAPLGLALAHGAGRVVIWGDDWILSDKELSRTDAAQAQPTAVFWRNALLWASNRGG